MGLRNRLSVTIILYILIITIFLLCANPSGASPFTVVTIELEEKPVSVDVSPGSSGLVTVSGNVTCIKWGPDQVKVSLIGNSSAGGTSVSPPNMVFGGTGGSEETKQFSATTKVPQGTSCTESGTIIVSGTWVQGGFQYQIEPVSSIFIIEQYYKINMFIANREYTLDAGEDVDFDIIVNNHGNGNDAIEIDITNREDLKGKGLTLSSLTQLNVPDGVNKTINMKVGTSEDTSGSYTIEISTLSKGSEKNGMPVYAYSTVSLKILEKDFSEELGALIISPMAFGLIFIIIMVAIIVKIFRS